MKLSHSSPKTGANTSQARMIGSKAALPKVLKLSMIWPMNLSVIGAASSIASFSLGANSFDIF